MDATFVKVGTSDTSEEVAALFVHFWSSSMHILDKTKPPKRFAADLACVEIGFKGKQFVREEHYQSVLWIYSPQGQKLTPMQLRDTYCHVVKLHIS